LRKHSFFRVFTANRAKFCFNLPWKTRKHEKFHLQLTANGTKICRENFRKKSCFRVFHGKLTAFFWFSRQILKHLNWILTRRLCKKKSFKNKLLFTKAPSQKPLLLIYQLDSKQHQQMQALPDALCAPWSSALRFLSFYDKFSFVYFETNLQSKRRKANRWFSCFAAEETLETPRDDQFSSNFGLLTANPNNFWISICRENTVLWLHSFSFFFCWSTLVCLHFIHSCVRDVQVVLLWQKIWNHSQKILMVFRN